MILLRGFTRSGAIEFQDGVDTDFPDLLGDGGFLDHGEFALVFMAAEFALDGHMCAFGKGAGEISEFPEGPASIPLGARFQAPASFFQDVLVASEKIAMLVELAAFLSASLPSRWRDLAR